MNPSYNNGGTSNAAAGGNSGVNNVPGVKPGVIASGPVAPSAPTMPAAPSAPVTPATPTMPAAPTMPAVPATPVTPADANAAKVSSVFGHKPTINTTPPVSPASDIILQPMSLGDSSKKPKKGLIIGGLVAIVLLIVGLVIGLLAMNGGNGGNNNTITGYSDFLKYANYLLNGTENTNSDLGSFDEEKDYAVTTAYIEDDREFFNKAGGLWKTFYDKVAVDGEYSQEYEDNSDLVAYIEYQNELMDYAARYMNTKILDDEDILALYTSNGFDNAKIKVDDNYKNLLNTTYPSGLYYANSLIKYAKDTIDLYQVYNSYGCIIDGTIDEVCIENNIAEIALVFREYIDKIPIIDETFIESVLDDLENTCFVIKDYWGQK